MLLQCYIDNKPDRELQCIYALQNFAYDRQYPQGKSRLNADFVEWKFSNHFFVSFAGLLNLTFEILYESEALSADAFETWQKSEGPKESQLGKGKSLSHQNNPHDVMFDTCLCCCRRRRGEHATVLHEISWGQRRRRSRIRRRRRNFVRNAVAVAGKRRFEGRKQLIGI